MIIGLEAASMRCEGRSMNRHSRIPLSDQAKPARDDLGAEPLAGLGSEDETWEPGVTG